MNGTSEEKESNLFRTMKKSILFTRLLCWKVYSFFAGRF